MNCATLRTSSAECEVFCQDLSPAPPRVFVRDDLNQDAVPPIDGKRDVPPTDKKMDVENTPDYNKDTTSVLETSMARTPEKRKLSTDPVYVGALSEKNFSTPKRRRINLHFLKNKMKHVQYENKKLKQQNKRLAAKVTSLKGLLKHLKSKNLLEEDAAESVMVRNHHNKESK